jgi:thiamine-monophosphate kinase
VRAAVDVSDGLAADLAHLCAASGVGARLEEASLPADEALRAAARMLSAAAGQERGPLPAAEGTLLTHLQTGPGDDYELLLALDPAGWERAAAVARAQGVPLARIGACVPGPGLELVARTGEVRPLPPHGWDHFAP